MEKKGRNRKKVVESEKKVTVCVAFLPAGASGSATSGMPEPGTSTSANHFFCAVPCQPALFFLAQVFIETQGALHHHFSTRLQVAAVILQARHVKVHEVIIVVIKLQERENDRPQKRLVPAIMEGEAGEAVKEVVGFQVFGQQAENELHLCWQMHEWW